MALFNNLMPVSPRGGHHENDLLQHSSPVAGQHGFCSSFHKGHRWLVSTALEANTDIDTHHAGHRLQTALYSYWLTLRMCSLLRGLWKPKKWLVSEWHMSQTVTAPQLNITNIWTETSDHVLSLIGCFGGRAGLCSSSTLRQTWTLSHVSSLSPEPGLWMDAPCFVQCTQHSLLCPTKDRPLPEWVTHSQFHPNDVLLQILTVL